MDDIFILCDQQEGVLALLDYMNLIKPIPFTMEMETDNKLAFRDNINNSYKVEVEDFYINHKATVTG